MAFSKRQKTDLGTAEFEITSLKKAVTQHKAELKHLGTVVINDLKNLKEETALHLSLIKSEQSENEEFRKKFVKLSSAFTKFNEEQKADIANLRKDFVSLREYNRVQVGSIKHVLETMLMEISKLKKDQLGFVSKTEESLTILKGQSLRLSEESNMHKSFSNKSKQDFDKSIEEFAKKLSESGVDSARMRLELGKMNESQKALAEDYKSRISILEENSIKTKSLVLETEEKSEKETKDLHDSLLERRREIAALQRKLESRAKLMIEEFNQSMDELKTDVDLLKTRTSNEQNQVVSYLEGVISTETGRLSKMVLNSVERMDEIDHMYDVS